MPSRGRAATRKEREVKQKKDTREPGNRTLASQSQEELQESSSL